MRQTEAYMEAMTLSHFVQAKKINFVRQKRNEVYLLSVLVLCFINSYVFTSAGKTHFCYGFRS